MSSPHAIELILVGGSCLISGIVLGILFTVIATAGKTPPPAAPPLAGNSVLEIRGRSAGFLDPRWHVFYRMECFAAGMVIMQRYGLVDHPYPSDLKIRVFVDGREQFPPAD